MTDIAFGFPIPPEAQNYDFVAPENRVEPVKLERRGVTSHLRQGQLWQKESLWRDSIVSKLRSVQRHDLADTVDACHREKMVMECRGCRGVTVFFNRCDNKWCPICAPKLAHERKELVEAWTKQIRQPKHVVLTARNTTEFGVEYLRRFKLAFAKLRRRKQFRNWKGGFYSIETTWSDTDGAHVHLHALIDARWIDTGALAIEWGRLMGQDYAIVKVKDARNGDYLRELCKYVAKGSEVAAWDGSRIAQFVDAISSVRMFGVFGSLFGLRKQIREFLDQIHEARKMCACGCNVYRWLDENEWQWQEVERELSAALPPPKPKQQTHPELPL